MGQTSQRYNISDFIEQKVHLQSLIQDFLWTSLWQHAGLFVWETDPRLPAADVHRGHLQLSAAALFGQRLQGARGNHHWRRVCSAPHSLVRPDRRMLVLVVFNCLCSCTRFNKSL